MALYTVTRWVYHRTLKPVRPLHKAVYWILTMALLPTLERSVSFHTPKEDPLWLRLAFLFGQYEPETVPIATQVVKPGMKCLDIGAHVGYYTKLLSRLTGPKGKVIAFEPHPATFGLLEMNTKALRNVAIVNKGVGNQPGTFTLWDNQLETMGAALSPHTEKRMARGEKVKGELTPRSIKTPGSSFVVQVTTVDEFLEGVGIEMVDFIKMDIEGAEVLALQGMQHTLSRSSSAIMVVEFSPVDLRDFGFQGDDLLGELKLLGFGEIAAILPDRFLDANSPDFKEISRKIEDDCARVNLLCRKR